MGFHFFLQGICLTQGLNPGLLLCRWILYQLSYQGSPSYYISESESPSVVSDSLRAHGLYSPWNSPGQNTGVGSHSLLQGIFSTQGSNPGLPHCRQILYQLSHQGSLMNHNGKKIFLKKNVYKSKEKKKIILWQCD